MPVGGAPSRSGFLATPTDASPKPTFSEHTPHPGRRDAACPPESGKRSSALQSSKVRKALEDDREKNVPTKPEPVRPRFSGREAAAAWTRLVAKPSGQVDAQHECAWPMS
jgi:hypothetical protein